MCFVFPIYRTTEQIDSIYQSLIDERSWPGSLEAYWNVLIYPAKVWTKGSKLFNFELQISKHNNISLNESVKLMLYW